MMSFIRGVHTARNDVSFLRRGLPFESTSLSSRGPSLGLRTTGGWARHLWQVVKRLVCDVGLMGARRTLWRLYAAIDLEVAMARRYRGSWKVVQRALDPKHLARFEPRHTLMSAEGSGRRQPELSYLISLCERPRKPC